MLTNRFTEALIYATQLHADQVRKGSSTPYVAHLLAVTALVLEAGGDEDIAIAALLHDAVEDQGGLETLAEIRKLFGERVAYIVDQCSDAYTIPKPPWRGRKEKYIERLRGASQEVRLVSLADKLHNARSLIRDLQEYGKPTWEKFNGGQEGTIWYFTTLVEVFKETESDFMVEELERVVTQIQQIAEL
jgi:(p)ppGpp synthase/HD superfamily hydrolase